MQVTCSYSLRVGISRLVYWACIRLWRPWLYVPPTRIWMSSVNTLSCIHPVSVYPLPKAYAKTLTVQSASIKSTRQHTLSCCEQIQPCWQSADRGKWELYGQLSVSQNKTGIGSCSLPSLTRSLYIWVNALRTTHEIRFRAGNKVVRIFLRVKTLNSQLLLINIL